MSYIPLASYTRISGRFGDPRPGHTHNGNDYAAAQGTDIVAPKDGWVIEVGLEGDGVKEKNGIYVKTLNDDGTISVYLHMKEFNPHFMQVYTQGKKVRVRAGDKLGEVGNTGYSFGPHLHYTEYDENGKPYDSHAQAEKRVHPDYNPKAGYAQREVEEGGTRINSSIGDDDGHSHDNDTHVHEEGVALQYGDGMRAHAEKKTEVEEMQEQLKSLGYNLGKFKDKHGHRNGIDGKFGPVTRKAVEKFQKDNGLKVTGKLDAATKDKLNELAPLEKAKEKHESYSIAEDAQSIAPGDIVERVKEKYLNNNDEKPTLAEIFAFIFNNEGFRSQVYDDPAGRGIKTVGYGFTMVIPHKPGHEVQARSMWKEARISESFDEVLNGAALSEPSARKLTYLYIQKSHEELKKIYPGFENFPKSVQVALADMIYQFGGGNLRNAMKDVTAEIKQGDFAEAAQELMDPSLRGFTKYSGGRRAAEVAAMLAVGEESAALTKNMVRQSGPMAQMNDNDALPPPSPTPSRARTAANVSA